MLAKKLQSALAGAAAGGAYIEDVFSTYLYTGNSSTQTITNGIDLAGEGGLVFIKDRTNGGTAWSWVDTARGIYQTLESQNTGGQTNRSTGITAFNSNGFSIGSYFDMNSSSYNYASWTFRKAPKFFDVVTYTGNATTYREIAHNLGSTPGCIIIKQTSASGEAWTVWHRSLAAINPSYAILLNSTSAAADYSASFNSTSPTSTVFTVGDGNKTNASGATYVAYLFAHDAGGFGDSGDENVISCGSFTTNGSGAATVTLGFEPQWVMQKRTDSTSDWFIADNMRGQTVSGSYGLWANLTDAEQTSLDGPVKTTATGFDAQRVANATYIYIAIRRGPMKTPESGTEVFAADASGNNIPSGGIAYNTTFPVDWFIQKGKVSGTNGFAHTRLLGSTYLATNLTDAEAASGFTFDTNEDVKHSGFNFTDRCAWLFRRAPGFFDVVCWTGDDTAPRNIPHNLGVAPEFMIVKRRNGTGSWACYHTGLTSATYTILLESDAAQQSATNAWRSTAPTDSVFTVGNDTWVNSEGNTYIAYLFASCPGVSKVGSYTGNGTNQNIDCGFSNGARFVLVKRISTANDWFVCDTTRGIIASGDPTLRLNTTDPEFTNDWLDPYSGGFNVVQNASTGSNVNGATYIYLAIA